MRSSHRKRVCTAARSDFDFPCCVGPGVQLYARTWPMSCYSRTLTNSIKITEHTHVVYMSRTSHPGFIVAARDFNVPVIALQAGSSDHSFNHGQALLKSLLVNRNAAEAKKVCESAGPSSVSCKDLQFWEVAEVTPEEQVHRFYEKEPEGTWRSGLNKIPSDLETKMRFSALRSQCMLINTVVCSGYICPRLCSQLRVYK